jgi:hypothetical protein
MRLVPLTDDNRGMGAHAPAILQPLRVFVASPGGVEHERQTVRDIAEELNVPLRGHGWEILVLGWEDRGPTAGRAQADINADVRLCDVFVGVLWDRWGTPTGQSTSGFAEEWAIARDRHESTGRPDLWLFFKRLPEPTPEYASENPQLDAVLDFRHEVEQRDLAFHKSFDDLDEFKGLVRRRLLDEIFGRSGLTRTDLEAAAIDWAAAYDDEPVGLLPDGRNRAALADELESSAPAEAAALLVALANDADEQGFAGTAERLRVQACRVWIRAGDSTAAVCLLRRLLGAHVWELRLPEADMLLRELGQDLPPDLASELNGWRACLEAPDKPAETAAVLEAALSDRHGFPLNPDTTAHWQVVRWRCLLHVGNPRAVLRDDIEIDAEQGGVHTELAMLRADASRAVDGKAGGAAWQDLRVLTVREATENPELAAWIATRTAFDVVAQEDLKTAEGAYADAATRWTKVAGASENAALAFFSAQAAAQLRRDWSFTGWSWRPIVAAQRGRTTGFVARAEELERDALDKRLDDRPGEAISLLRAAEWCHLRTGFLSGVMRCRSLLAAAYASAGDEARAVGLHCEVGQRGDAEKVARDSVDRSAVAARMAEASPAWAAEARFAVLAEVGSCANPDVVNQLTVETIAATEPKPGRKFDNTPAQAADALASLVLAVEDAAVLQSAAARLEQLAGDEHYSLAQAGRFGLRALHDIGVIDAADVLIARFVANEGPDEPDPIWVGEHLNTSARLQLVRQAALAGHRRALLALLEADIPAEDAQVRAVCVEATVRFLDSDIGMTPDGSGMWGLMALDAQGSIAAATGDETMRRAAAERLLIYAADSRWPMVNRVRAVRGIWPLVETTDHDSWLNALRPLARPESDLDEAADRHLREMWTRRGDLEATALAVCAEIAAKDPPGWLDQAVGDARFDERTPMRVNAWRAAGEGGSWFDVTSARHALHDESAEVRIAVLHAWRNQGQAPPPVELRRLALEKNGGVRLALIWLLEAAPDDDAIAALRNDPDAYVRGITRKHLG